MVCWEMPEEAGFDSPPPRKIPLVGCNRAPGTVAGSGHEKFPPTPCPEQVTRMLSDGRGSSSTFLAFFCFVWS